MLYFLPSYQETRQEDRHQTQVFQYRPRLISYKIVKLLVVPLQSLAPVLELAQTLLLKVAALSEAQGKDKKYSAKSIQYKALTSPSIFYLYPFEWYNVTIANLD
jgi:hypothetical protein